MATHTTTGGGAYGRKFNISRENGQIDKDGRPYFFEWLKELPADTGKRKFETRTSANGARHYELFSALDGYLIDIRKETKDLGKGAETWLVLQLIDADDEYLIEVGRLDERYSMDIMKRLLNPHFSPNQKLRLSPYSIKEGTRVNMGLSAYSGADRLEHSQTSDFLRGIPRAESREWKGKTEWDFSNVANWLFEQVTRLVLPHLVKDPISAPKNAEPKTYPTTRQPGATVTADDNFPTNDVTSYPETGNAKQVPVPAEDDLPF